MIASAPQDSHRRTSEIRMSIHIFLFIIIAVIFFVFSIAFPIQVQPVTDLYNYQQFWYKLQSQGLWENIVVYEPGFVIFAKFCSLFFSFSGFVWLIKFLAFYSFLLFCISLNKNILLVFPLAVIFFVFFPPFDSISGVVIRQGGATAVAFFYLSVIDFREIKLKNFVCLSFLAAFFHYSAIFILFSVVLMYAVRGLGAFYIWCILNVLYIFNIPGLVGSFFYENSGLNLASLEVLNTDPSNDYTIGFKLPFLLVSIVFIMLPIIFSFFGMLKISVKRLLVLPLFRFYLVLNSLCIPTSLLPYHDRFFIWSWVFGPALIIYSLSFFKYNFKKFDIKSHIRNL